MGRSDRIRVAGGAVGAAVAVAALAVLVGARDPSDPADRAPSAGPTTTLASTTATEVSPTGAASDGLAGLRLVFDDSFDRAPLDDGRWNRCYPWAIVLGRPSAGCTNHGNVELQWYLPENVTVTAGQLRLEARRQTTDGLDRNGRPTTFDYTSGMVTTADHFEFRYGVVEFRVQVPATKAAWPALWLLPTDRSWPPEIDVLEIFGPDTRTAVLGLHRRGRPKVEFRVPTPDLSATWHTFAVDWRPGSLAWFIDGRLVASTNEDVPDVTMYLLANLAVAGNPPGTPDADAPYAAALAIDHIRVWQADVHRAGA